MSASRGLPYGSVMATAGAAALAAPCGLGVLVVPLLVLAMVLAAWVPVMGVWRRRDDVRRVRLGVLAMGLAGENAGMHTVPLGLAVILGGLAGLTGGRAGSSLLPFIGAGLFLVWVLTLLYVARFLWSLVVRGLDPGIMDGTWFLVPATLLGAAIATQDVAASVGGWSAASLAVLAFGGALLGWLGYWGVAAVACVRVRRFGLGGAPQAPWWIAMGCAGLAAAALGRVLGDRVLGLPLRDVLVVAMTATEVCAVVLCVPVVVGSARFLLRNGRFRGAVPWPPTFSTAVFALGCLQTAEILRVSGFRFLGLGTGFVTLSLWTATAGWNLGILARRRDVVPSGVRGNDRRGCGRTTNLRG